MENRFHAGWNGLRWAAAVAGVCLVTATVLLASTPAPVGNLGGPVDPTASEPSPTVDRPLLYPRSNYMWPFVSGPNYGEVAGDQWDAPGVLHTRVGSFDLKRGRPQFPASLRATNRLGQIPAQYFVVQVDPASFNDGQFDSIKNAIETKGGAIVRKMPVAAFVTRLTSEAFSAIASAPGVLAVEPYHPAFKLSPTIGRSPLPDPAKALSEVYTLEAMLFRGEDPLAVSQALAKLGANVVATSGDVVRFEINRNRLGQVAALEPIESIHEFLPVFPHGEESASSVQTGRPGRGAGDLAYTDAGIDGGGGGIAPGPQVLMILDSGISLDAGDLSNTRVDAGAAGLAHRKVRLYQSTNAFGGTGDTLGCDAQGSGSFTHGHLVAAAALGAANRVSPAYGLPWAKTDTAGNPWKFDGVAPGAVLVAYDAQVTPTLLGCQNPANSGLLPGTLYTNNTPGSGSLGGGYTNNARVFNFSWGATDNPTYGANAVQVDNFLFENPAAMVFISAGNVGGLDTDANLIPDENTVHDPATAKSATVIGASNTFAASGGSGNNRAAFSSNGPATVVSGRVAPILMAPGTDTGTNGLASEYGCRSDDNNQTNPVLCDTSQGAAGTSFAAPAAAGAALVVRDYFAQGFYPDGTSSNSGNAADLEPDVSGALVKAILVASADWMNGVDPNTGRAWNLPGTNLTRKFRFNNEQGYGRIQLNNALPLSSYPSSPHGLVVCDGGVAGGSCNIAGISGTTTSLNVETHTFAIADDTEELRISLAWVEDSSDALTNNLDLELQSPSGLIYYGNYFTDDNNRNNVIDAGENCDYAQPTHPWPPATPGQVDPGPWSVPTCANSARDTKNPTEAIFLSADPALDGVTDDAGTIGLDESADNQLELGTWTLRIRGGAFAGSQTYALAMVGPVSVGSTASLERVRSSGQLASGSFICNDKAQIDINEVDEGTDPAAGLTVGEISSRVTVQVVDLGTDGLFNTADDQVRDTETNLTFTDADGVGPGLKFSSNQLILSDATAPDPGNGVLDVQSGWRVRVLYADETGGVPAANKLRSNSALVDCRTLISAGGVVWGRWGRDAFSLVSGGCEKDARGLFTFGFPDNYMDEGELVDYRLAFQSTEAEDLIDVTVSLTPVEIDADSPKDCSAGSTTCADPNRQNNPVSAHVTVLDSPKTLGRIRAGNAVSANFSVQVNAGIPANTTIEMLLGVSARKSGKPVESYAVSRHPLNRDEVSFFYSTDFPAGGVENRDSNNNESLETVTTDEFDLFADNGDYRVETGRTWSSLTATGRNTGINAPWNFDTNDGGFRSGLHNSTDTSTLATIAQWGEDRNFNGTLDAGEDRDPVNTLLDQGWNTLGGCGWQTSSGASRGVWHTGRINDTAPQACVFNANGNGRCQAFETFPGTTGASRWWELLLTPVFQKVNQCATGAELNCGGRIDAVKDPVFTVEFLNMAWNGSMDIADTLTAMTWHVDTDTSSVDPIDLVNDSLGTNLNFLFGQMGAISGGNSPLTNGYPMFAPISMCLPGPDGVTLTCGGYAGGTACVDGQQCTGNTLHGSLGGNRTSQNSCFFEGKTAQVVNAIPPLGLPEPLDDDANNGWCGRTDGLNGLDRQKLCVSNAQCALAPYNGTCNFDNGTVDEYVTSNGPLRNMDITQVNGPDMRFSTLEDLFGDSGASFQASLGFFAGEGDASESPVSSFGVAVDDVVVEWREYRLDTDATPCAGGSAQCATLNISQTNTFEGNTFVRITVLDASPYSVSDPVNDCNGNGSFGDAGDDTDCNNNGTTDVTVRLTSQTETVGEIAVLDRVGATSEYLVEYPISVSYNSPGVLFLSKSGTANPTVTAAYTDRNDGTGSPCGNTANLAQRGLIQDTTTVFLTSGRVALKGLRLQDNGDNDGFADTNETVTLFVTLTNKSGLDLNDLTASLQSSDSKIDCINTTSVRFTDPGNVDPSLRVLPNKASRESLTGFQFRVGNFSRVGLNDRFTASFQLTVRSDRFDVGVQSIPVTIELDLNASGGGGTSPYTESFESLVRTTFVTFTSQTLDVGRQTVTNSNGYRCQYNDPDGPNSNDPGATDCFLGFTVTANNLYDWHIHDGGALDNNTGRAYVGTRSLHWGVHPAAGAKRDTTRFSQLDAIRSSNPVNLPVAVSAEMSFKHQVSLTDNRITNTPFGHAADRGVVAVQVANNAGTAVGDWIKIYPYENQYDAQGTDLFTNCTFDPIDDGSNEDSFFDPADPFRRTGPSSTCFPEFVFANAGDTDYQNAPADLSRIGRVTVDGPGLKGSVDRGVWVQPRFDLSEFKGRRVRFRFLATTINVGTAVTVNDTNIGSDNEVGDDGWYIDDMQVPQAIGAPVTLALDTAANAGLAPCASCSTINAAVLATPSSSAAPGQPIEVDASASSANACPSGTLQFQFWEDVNANGTVSEADGDVILRNWTDNPVYLDAPLATIDYGVVVRCSTNFACVAAAGGKDDFSIEANSATAHVPVGCPGTGNAKSAFQGNLGFSNKTTVAWTVAQGHDAIRGNLDLLRSSVGSYTGTVLACLVNNGTGKSFADATSPANPVAPDFSNGFYYLTRPLVVACNATGTTWSANVAKEAAGRDAELALDVTICP